MYDKLLQFLYDRDVRSVTKEDIMKWDQNAVARLYRLYEGDKTTNSGAMIVDVVTFDNEYQSFCLKYPRWKSCRLNIFESFMNQIGLNDKAALKPILFWEAYEHIKDLKVIRRQMSGLCFIHAPVVLQHYLCSIGSDGLVNNEMLDIEKVSSKFYKGDALYDYIIRNEGGSSLNVLRDIIAPENRISKISIPNKSMLANLYSQTCQTVTQLLQIKPALVSGFVVDDNFQTSNSVSFRGTVNHRSIKGLHAMVLIGARIDPVDGEYWFLLQNWWKDRFFIEVTGEYLASSECSLNFVENTITSISETLPLTHSSYAETSIDACETVHEIAAD